ncbi:AAA family ATPase [Zooshikella ganghwensis]|uniref:AAA family ATPase n=1 Tax=Zooshikella ganghwensis TaxID=202772 RepID=UPI000422D32E|nr:AAA family ATPase [Zooshikella ganghwensis]
MIYLIGGEKGGSGKSCIAQNFAVALKRRDHDVLLVDADPQLTTFTWVKERSKNDKLQHIPCVQLHNSGADAESLEAVEDVRKTLQDLKQRYQTIVIDAGGQDSEALRAAMTVADRMIIPLRPKRRDLKTLLKMRKLVAMATAVNPKLIARSVLTQCPPSNKSINKQVVNKRVQGAKDICESFEIPALNSFIVMRNAYDDSDEAGCAVFEGPDSVDEKAIEEIEEMTKEILEI